MANQHTVKKQAATPDPNFAHVGVGPSNEELLAKHLTEEAERAAKGYPKVEMGADAYDKQLDGWGDVEHDPLGSLDPLAALKKAHGRPGFGLKLMSPKVTQALSGTGGYKPVIANGDPVTCGSMILGEIPQRFIDARKRQVADKTRSELSQIRDKRAEQIEQLRSEAKAMGLAVSEINDNTRDSATGEDRAAGVSVIRDVELDSNVILRS